MTRPRRSILLICLGAACTGSAIWLATTAASDKSNGPPKLPAPLSRENVDATKEFAVLRTPANSERKLNTADVERVMQSFKDSSLDIAPNPSSARIAIKNGDYNLVLATGTWNSDTGPVGMACSAYVPIKAKPGREVTGGCIPTANAANPYTPTGGAGRGADGKYNFNFLLPDSIEKASVLMASGESHQLPIINNAVTASYVDEPLKFQWVDHKGKKYSTEFPFGKDRPESR